MNCLPCKTPQVGTPFKAGRSITIESNGDEPQKYDLLVIACDPQSDNLTEEVMKKTATEKKVFSSKVMKSFIFQTTLVKFPKVDSPDDPIEIFNPINLKKAEGLLHSYRSETRKEAYQRTVQSKTSDPKAYYTNLLNGVSHEYVTMYQIIDPTQHSKRMNEDQIFKLVMNLLKQFLN